jgi:hypothetical protein
VILGDAYIGTEAPHVWTGGLAAIEIDLHRGIEIMLGEARRPGDRVEIVERRETAPNRARAIWIRRRSVPFT